MPYIGTGVQDPNYFASEPGSVELEGGTYNQDRLYNSSTATVTGDITLTNNLVLARITDKGNNVTLTSDGTTRTITGSGKIESGNIVTTLPGNFTGMTGEIGSTVTGSPNLNLTTGSIGSDVTFPAGHVIQTVVAHGDATSHETANSTTKVYSTVHDITINNVKANSKCVIYFWSGARHVPTDTQMDIFVKNMTRGRWLPDSAHDDAKENIGFVYIGDQTMPYNYGLMPLLFCIDDTPDTGTNRYQAAVARRAGSGTVYLHHGNDAPHYMNMVQEIAQ